MEIKIKEDCIEVDGEKYIKEYEDEELEYLGSYGDRYPESSLTNPISEYKLNLKKLNYNFNGEYSYYTSKTDIGTDMIWRKKE